MEPKETLKKLLLIINPKAGRMKSKQKLFQIANEFCSLGYQVTLQPTTKPGDATEIVKNFGENFDLLACCGGDGTLNEVTAGIMELDNPPPVGYIPTGTTNDLAETLGLASTIEENVRIAATGVPYKIDSGVFNGRVFNYVAAFGVFSDAAYSTTQTLKNLFGHASYFLFGAKSFAKMRSYNLKIETPEETYEGEFLFGNIVSSISVGGILKLDPNLVKLDDGLFEVFLIRKPKSTAEFLSLAIRALRGDLSNENIIFTHASSVKITGPADMDWALDGEYQKGSESVFIENRKQALTIIRPAEDKKEKVNGEAEHSDEKEPEMAIK